MPKKPTIITLSATGVPILEAALADLSLEREIAVQASNAAALEAWWRVQRKNRGHYYKCAKCNADLVLKHKPHRKNGYYASLSSLISGEPDCCGKPVPPIPTPEKIEAVFFGAQDHERRISLRLRTFAQHPERLLGGDEEGPETNHARRSAHSLLGFAWFLCEIARHNIYSPLRGYARDFTEIMPDLGQRVGELETTHSLDGFDGKIVIPEATEDETFNVAIEKALVRPTHVEKFEGRAIVIGRLWNYRPTGNCADITLTNMGSVRLFADSYVWNRAAVSFGRALRPGEREGIETYVIAVVERRANRLEVVELAWSWMNAFGMLFPGRYEATAAAQLISNGYTFAKVLHQRLRVGKWAMLVDFIVRCSEPEPEQKSYAVVEIDPKRSAWRKQSKRLRTERARTAGLSVLSFDENLSRDIRVSFPPGYGPFLPDAFGQDAPETQ
jgi:hypothetical protein